MPSNFPHKGYRDPYLARVSSQQHYLKSIYHESPQQQSRRILREIFLTNTRTLHLNGLSVRRATACQVLKAAVYRELHGASHHQKESLHQHPMGVAGVLQQQYPKHDLGCVRPKIR